MLPRLSVLGLREGVTGLPLAHALGVAAGRVEVTGDDSLELAVGGRPAPRSDVLGVNIRLAGYTNLDLSGVAWIGGVIRTLADERAMTLLALPVSRHACSDDLQGVTQMLPGLDLPACDSRRSRRPGRAGGRDPTLPSGRHRELSRRRLRARRRRSSGVPVPVGLLRRQVPRAASTSSSAATMVALDGPDGEERLTAALTRASETPSARREQARDSALEQVRRGQALYARFLEPWSRSAPTWRAAPVPT